MAIQKFDTGEYKIIRGKDSDCQKWLNQWRHEYLLNILTIQVTIDGEIVILLLRTPLKLVDRTPSTSKAWIPDEDDYPF